jgi:hypothetical protein
MPKQAFASKHRPMRLIACAAVVLLVVSGCGTKDELNRQAFSGTVTIDGKPLQEGTIRYTPDGSGAGTDVSTEISSGKYSFSKYDGPVPGAYKVAINSIENTAFEAPQGKTPGEFVIPPRKQQVPGKYNLKTTLTAQVKEGQSTSIDFSLASK